MTKTLIQKTTERDEKLWRDFEDHCKSLDISYGAGLRALIDGNRENIIRIAGRIQTAVTKLCDGIIEREMETKEE